VLELNPLKPSNDLLTMQKEEKTTYAANNEIDQIAREVWGGVREGNKADGREIIRNFMTKYHDHIDRGPEFPVAPSQERTSKQRVITNADAAGGLDGWTKQEFRWLSDLCFDWLARWMNTTE
jgi:hypothetical protein